MQHNFETIARKIKMGGSVLPAETVLCLRDILIRLEAMEEKLNGLEKSAADRSRTDSVSKGKVSKSKVQPGDDK